MLVTDVSARADPDLIQKKNISPLFVSQCFFFRQCLAQCVVYKLQCFYFFLFFIIYVLKGTFPVMCLPNAAAARWLQPHAAVDSSMEMYFN